MSAGVMKSGPRTRSRSRVSRTRVRQGRRAGAPVAGRVPIATATLARHDLLHLGLGPDDGVLGRGPCHRLGRHRLDRKSTRLNSTHLGISYAAFCLKKKMELIQIDEPGRIENPLADNAAGIWRAA